MSRVCKQNHKQGLQELLNIPRVRCMGKKSHGNSRTSCSKLFSR